jgi:hypothetical protein
MSTGLALDASVLAALIVACVQMAKAWGLPAKSGGLLAVVLGLVFGGLEVLCYLVPDAKPIVEIMLTCLGLGLAGAGFYSTTKASVELARDP